MALTVNIVHNTSQTLLVLLHCIKSEVDKAWAGPEAFSGPAPKLEEVTYRAVSFTPLSAPGCTWIFNEGDPSWDISLATFWAKIDWDRMMTKSKNPGLVFFKYTWEYDRKKIIHIWKSSWSGLKLSQICARDGTAILWLWSITLDAKLWGGDFPGTTVSAEGCVAKT